MSILPIILAGVLVVSARGADTIYVSNLGQGNVLRYSADGVGSVFAGVSGPTGIAVDNLGDVYVATEGGTIFKFTPSGTSSIFATTGSPGSTAPWGLALDSKRDLFVADGSGTIDKFTPNGVGTVFASGLSSPYALACDGADNVYATSGGNILKFTPNGSGSVFVPSGQLFGTGPMGLAFDNAGNLYASSWNNFVMEFTPGGVGSVFTDAANFPEGLAFDGEGNLFVVNHSSGTVEKFTPGGIGSVFADIGVDDPNFIAITQVPTPEPSAIGLMVLGAVVFLVRQRRLSRFGDGAVSGR